MIGVMAKRKTADSSSSKDRHKEAKQVRINKKLANALDALAERNASTSPVEVNRAVREMLEREGFWPPKQ